MLSNFIRRNGKRKANRVIAPRPHKMSFSASESSQTAVASPLVLDINEESLIAQGLPVVQLNFSNSNEEWFPQDLLRSRSSSPSMSPHRSQNAPAAQEHSAHEARANLSPVPSLSQSEDISSVVASRKKSIPAPIMIPDHVMPNVQIGHSAGPTSELPTEAAPPNANGASLNQSSPSASDNLSSISGTTLARALIASSFVLSSSEHRSSRHRSGVARQDSATLPSGSFFLSNSGSSSPIPPVPPVPAVPANLVTVSPNSSHSTTVKSGASTESEYPMSDTYITSPEMVNDPVIPRQIPRAQEVSSLTPPTSTKAPPPPVSNTKPQRKAGPVAARTQVPKNGMFDVPITAVEVSLPIISQQSPQPSTQEGSTLLSSDDHSLDEFDFLPPEPPILVASPESDSSVSYISPATNRRQWKRRAGGSNPVWNGSKDSFADSTFASQQVHGIPSASTPEPDYGELFNYDLTVSPESGLSSSSASADYQTFPETPVVFSPLWSSGYAFFARSDSQVLRRRLSNMRSVGRGSGKLHSNMKTLRRQVANKDGGGAIPRRSQSSSVPRQRALSPKLVHSSLPHSVPVSDDAGLPEDETNQSLTNKVESQNPGKLSTADCPHPLAHISPSTSYVLEEEALQALAKHSHSSLPSITIGDPSFDPTTISVSDTGPSTKPPTSVPLPGSTDVSPFNSPAPTSGSTAVSLSMSPFQLSLPTTSTAISQSESSKSLLSPPTSSLGESSFLPSTPRSSSLDRPLPRTNSAIETPSFSIASDELISHPPSPSFVPPPPHHTVVSERTTRRPSSTTPSLSRISSIEPAYQRSQQASNSFLASSSTQSRARLRPPLPLGPRKPSGPGQVCGPFFPGIRGRNGSSSSVGSSDPAGSLGFPWRKLHTAASKPPPKFQAPPPKWRGLTLEAAQWTFTSAQLQQIVSQAIQQSSEGGALRFLRPDVLEGEIADEIQGLELRHVDIKAQYRALSRKRWILMGAMAGNIEDWETSDATMAARTLDELAEVESALEGLTDKMHDVVLRTAQLKSLCDVHNTSALAMAVRKINGVFVRQLAEKEQLQEQVDMLRMERDEAWKHAEDIAQDYDTLNDRVSESGCGCGNDAKAPNGDTLSATSSRRSTQISAKRKSSIRQSQAGLRSRSRSRQRTRRSSGNTTRPTSLALDDIPPVPRLPVNPSMGSSAWTLQSGMSYGSATSGTSAALALAEAQREVYEMLGLSLPASQASSRRRTLSGSAAASQLPSPKSRPASESLDMRARPRLERCRATRSVVLDDRYHIRPLAIAKG